MECPASRSRELVFPLYLAFTFGAVLLPVGFPCELAAVVDQEAGHTRELVILDGGDDLNLKFFAGKVSAGKFECVSQLPFVQVDVSVRAAPLAGASSARGKACSSSGRARGAS